MNEPGFDPSVVFDSVMRDAYRTARILHWAKFLGGLGLYAAVVIVALGAAVGVARWLAGV
jgi:hypothetical protein